MPKRKRLLKDYDEIRRKLKKLQRELHRVCDARSADSGEDRDSYYEYSDHSDKKSIRYESENSLDGDIYGDFPEYPPEDGSVEITDFDLPANNSPQTANAPYAVSPASESAPVPTTALNLTAAAVPTAAPITVTAAAPTVAPPAALIATATHTVTSTDIPSAAHTDKGASPVALDSAILEILGLDPSASIEYGREIRKELACRLEHIATTGLTKEARKELLEKYLIPANCTKIGAPLMNAEIKAAITDIIAKRDKGIETRQKQIACAISGLAGLMSRELESNDKDNDRLKQLMDVSRLLCDVQHNESVTRRNFAIYSIKRDLKDHVTNTKIDKYLFGEGLAETLKTAKAVSKSGTDLKVKAQVRSLKPYTPTTSHLNWRSQAPARRQQGPQRRREPAYTATPGPSTRHYRAPRQGNSSKTSQPAQRPKDHRRR